MRTLNYILLAVADPARSATFYSSILGIAPVENSPTFVLYVLPNGLKIGLWLTDEVAPAAKPAGGVELSFTEDSRDAVLATYAAWKDLAKVVQEPTDMDFGFTFVVEDLDGHRLRPFVLADRPR